MDTRVVCIDPYNIDHQQLQKAGALIRDGGLVAFPTETVYGLGANGLDAYAVKRIYGAKGRPSDNPLILHISSAEELDRLVAGVPQTAVKLMDRFWPGPLTLILKKSSLVPEAVTAGLETVAIRMPSHPVAMSLIKYAGVPVAAPSANISGKPSPTRAAHVIRDLLGRVDMIIDGGDVAVGLESTVAEVIDGGVVILRPGGITPEQIREVVGDVALDPAIEGDILTGIPKAPGMKYAHYSPEADVIIIEGPPQRVVAAIDRMAKELEGRGKRVGIMATEQTGALYRHGRVISVGDREEPSTIAAGLFAALREFDALGVDVILAEGIEQKGVGLAVMNRLLKAAAYHVIKV
ncbi:MAG: L-threonylcarbamoyladenylate synthase [Firmicutes bacterium]|nr:L-threonylcarbamoyladenylate synthase [Bacillota bacterium]MDD3298339.1 L-threonylcarbamoyladenylate synthase [Bacillota bacterium]MDD3850558.1 L-threonylcarbamoyladenylate synthase [Bacillota bacterium]MDD4707337.1 L-threonylcarbamoyladenylate synthase [Bacillota bacterium]